MNEIDFLLKLVCSYKYPESMFCINGEITSVAFFPGGKGTFDHSNTISDKPIMVLGQDFDTKGNYVKLRDGFRADPRENPTWRNLLQFLENNGIMPDCCFFTNAILGARNSNNSVGKSPGLKNRAFAQFCKGFFLQELAIQKPHLILVLGRHAAKFLGELSPDLKPWSSSISIAELDLRNDQCKKGVMFSNGVISNVLLLTHPSYRNVNVKKRRYKTFRGDEAESKMLLDLLKGK